MSPRLLRRILRAGRVAAPAPPRPEASLRPGNPASSDAPVPSGKPVPSGEPVPQDDAATAAPRLAATARALGGSVQVRQVDAGSCNGCELEIGAAFGPVYDAERYGARLVASPRHADVLLVTGAVTRNMAEPLERTLEATPEPRCVIAVGDCARDCGVFRGGRGVHGAVSDVVPVDLEVPGCPPEPDAIVAALRAVTGR